MTKKPKLHWNREGEAYIKEGGKIRRLAVVEWSFKHSAYVTRKRPYPGPFLLNYASFGTKSDAKRAVEKRLGMERGR